MNLCESVFIPRGDGKSVHVDLMIPTVSSEFDPDIMRTTIVIIPGGGYRFICEREAEPVALYFAAHGFNTAVVRYSVSPSLYPEALLDVGAVINYIRQNSNRFHSHKDHIVVMGFSAGGHIAACMSSLWKDENLWSRIGLAPENVRPNAAVLCYPVITGGQFAHRDSFVALTGSEDTALHESLSAEKSVNEDTAPTFIWATWTDQAVPAINSVLYAEALYKNGVKAELHLYPVGLHGLSLSRDFTCYVKQPEKAVAECENWPALAMSFVKRLFTVEEK